MMNNDISKVSLTLLRSALWGSIQEGTSHPCGDDWKEIADFFTRQSLDGLLPDGIAALPSSLQPSMAIKMSMIARQLQVERMNKRMNAELLAFTTELEQRAIPYILLKGQGVAALYPNPSHRMCGDIDLYVPKEHLAVVDRGFAAFGATRTAETRHHVNYKANGIEWELHHCVYYFQKESRNHLFMQFVDEAMCEAPHYAAIGEGKVRVLPPTMNVMLLLAHIVDHFYCEGVGLRQLCDYALLLHKHRNEIDKALLMERLEALSLTRSYRVFGYICVHYLGMPEETLLLKPSAKDIRLAHRVMADCISGGNFGRAESNRRQTLWQNITFYTRFFSRLWRYRQLCPSEALWWPLAKISRALKGEVNISEERSAVHATSN